MKDNDGSSIYLEKMTIADQLVKLGLAWQSSLQVFDDAPNEILWALQQDKAHGAFENYNLMKFAFFFF